MNGILLVSSFSCDICDAVSRPISWARCLSVVTVEFFEGLAHFLAFVVKVGVDTTEEPQSEELSEWVCVFYVLCMRGRMLQIVLRICWFVVYASRLQTPHGTTPHGINERLSFH